MPQKYKNRSLVYLLFYKRGFLNEDFSFVKSDIYRRLDKMRISRRHQIRDLINGAYIKVSALTLFLAFTVFIEIYESFTFAKFGFFPQQPFLDMEHSGQHIATRIANTSNTFILGNHTRDKGFVTHEGDSANAMGGIYFVPTSLDHTNATWVDIEYVYVCAYGGAATPEGRVFYPDFSNMLPRYAENGPVVGYYEDVVSIGSRWVVMYAHWVYDSLAPLLFMPQEVIDRSVFLLPVNSTIYMEALETFGFLRERGQILLLNSSEWVFAHHYHNVYNPEPVHGCLVWALKELSRKWRTQFGVKDMPAIDYAIYNRPKGNRHLADIEDWIFASSVRFPWIRWVLLEELYPTFGDSVKAYSRVKLLFAPTGSNFANMVFMNSGTAIVCALGDMGDVPVYAAAEVMHIWCISVSVPNMRHHGGPYGILNYEASLLATEKAIFAIDNQRWPKPEELEK